MSLFDPRKIQFLNPDERVNKRLFWRDDMENYTTNKWTPAVGDTVAYQNAPQRVFEGDYCLAISDAGATSVFASLDFGMMPKQKIEVEFKWFCDLSEINQLNLEIRNFDGALRQSAEIIYLTGLRQWRYVDANGNPRNIKGGNIRFGDHTWRYFKLGVDLLRNRYVDLVTTGHIFDLSTLPIRTIVNAAATSSQFRLYGTTVVAGDILYIDDFRIYVN